MKKGAAISLLVAEGFVVVAAAAGVSFLLVSMYYFLALLPMILAVAGAVFGITRLRGDFETHYGISAPRFGLLAFVPSIAVSGLAFAVARESENARAVRRVFLGGEGGYLFTQIWLITSAAAAVIGAIMLVISCARKRSLSKRSEKGDRL